MEAAIWDAVKNPSATSEQLRLLPEVVCGAKESSDIQALDPSRYSYKCNVCGDGKKPFFGLQPLQDHLNGKAHNKMKRLIKMTSATQIGASSNSSPQKALVPDSTTSSLPPEIQKLLEDKTVKMLETNGIVSFECLVCDVPLTDVAPVKQHIDGKSHKKKINQKGLIVADSQGLPPQPPENMEWNNSDSSQTQEPNQYQPIPEEYEIKYPDSPIMNDSNTYKILSNPRGLVYIFNNTFSGSPHERKGSKQDSKNLTLLFHKMGYKVELCEDMNKNAMLLKLTEIQNNQELKHVDSLIILIMSHGDEGKDERRFCSNDLESIELDEVRYRFTASQCPALIGKAKIFLSNFCRGAIREKPVKLESDAPVNYVGLDAPRDMCTIHASISGFQAMRDKEKGTVFALKLIKVLSQYSHNTEMADLYRELCREMIKVTTPEQQNYFFLRFYFNPTPPLSESTP